MVQAKKRFITSDLKRNGRGQVTDKAAADVVVGRSELVRRQQDAGKKPATESKSTAAGNKASAVGTDDK